MNRKDILELKRRFKKNECTFTKMAGCYVNGEKKILLEFKETFLNLADEDFFKFLEISKKVLSGGVGNNLLQLNFPLDENFQNEKQASLMRLKKSGLKDDTMLSDFYHSVIEHYDYAENYLILIFHDAYDVMTKTSDNLKLDESEEVYEYILCAICPVSLSKPGLGYFNEERKIKSRLRDWVVGMPSLGFVYPAFIDRSSDVNALMYYTKNAKDPHPELMKNTLGCSAKQTATIQKEIFQSIIETTVALVDEDSEKVFIEIQENLNTLIEEHQEVYENTDEEHIALSKEKVKELLIESGVSEEATAKIEASFEENFSDDLPLAENLIDTKLLKANAQKKKEETLIKQVEQLESKLEEVSNDSVSERIDETTELRLEEEIENTTSINYDVVLHVNPSKLSKIKTEIINGQKCIVVPINDDEQATINGREDLI